MTYADVWQPLYAELDRWASQGRRVRLWLRDDDATEPTDALDRLLDLTARTGVPLLLAVIPLLAVGALTSRLRGRPDVLPCQHGARHRNHAASGEKPEELGAHRPLAETTAELLAARQRMDALFGDDHLRGVLVPPWNRIAPVVAGHLASLGIDTLSAFGPPRFDAIRQINCDLDIMDWRATRQGHDAAHLVPALCACLASARIGRAPPVGVLTHHAAHGDTAWAFLEALLTRTQAHPGAEWVAFTRLL